MPAPFPCAGLRFFEALCYTLPMESKRVDAGNEHAGHRGRLRERFNQAGLMGFAPHEALELLLTYAIPRRDVNPLAHRLLKRFGSLNRVLEAKAEDLATVSGIGPQAASLLSLVLPLFRLYQQGLTREQAAFSGHAGLLAYCRALLLGERLERFLVLSLDAGGKLITHSVISSGDEGETAVYPGLIARELVRNGAAACVLVHNHPSGEARPSEADKRLTAALKDILQPLSITISDHVIIADDKAYSFLEQGLI